jgi:hypothetical protein
MIAMTTKSSTSVKPFSIFLQIISSPETPNNTVYNQYII